MTYLLDVGRLIVAFILDVYARESGSCFGSRSVAVTEMHSVERDPVACKIARSALLLTWLAAETTINDLGHRGASLVHMSRLDRITVDQAVCHGSPCIRGMRYPVEMIVELLASGMKSDDVLADYPDLELDDVLAALEFAAKVTRTRSVIPTSAA